MTAVPAALDNETLKWPTPLPIRMQNHSHGDSLGSGLVAISSLAKILGECSTIQSPPTLFYLLIYLFIFENGDLRAQRTLIPLFMPGSVHSGAAS